jgi:hypothetical protein
MSIHEFHSRFVSGDERHPLIVALRRLSRLQDAKSLIHATTTGWPSWDTPPGSGVESCLATRLA